MLYHWMKSELSTLEFCTAGTRTQASRARAMNSHPMSQAPVIVSSGGTELTLYIHVYLKTNTNRSTAGTKKLTTAAARRTFHHTILCEAAQDVVRDAGETAAAAPMVQ